MDTDGDGQISESEFRKGMQAISDKVGEEQLLDSITRAWTDHPLALEKAKKEKERILAAVAQDGLALRHAGTLYMNSMKKDKEVVLAAVAENPLALDYADDSLKKDADVVLAAVAKTGSAFRFADKSLKKNKE